ncbi:MAG: acyl-[ACP]--phospholipid O-acyltransferase [Candidatus Acidiferrum sp.]|jgi:acyl-[acyl-carrier-protein]-phospholipid O-acyltransferase/long-chain-fatty-acid--[acyl-carrier-protein] ligase
MPDAPRPWRLGFWSLIATQFQGAFNDNGLKFLILYLIIGTNLTPDQEDSTSLWVGLLFAAPFILFSMTGGYFADRFSKRSVTIGTKVFEIAVMAFAIFGFAVHSMPVLLSALFLASTQGALFGPSKYGLLPEILPENRLSWGNGVIELGTFLAAIGGTVVAGQLPGWFGSKQGYSGVFFLVCSVVGLMTSLGISRVPAADPAKKFRINFLGDLWEQGERIAKDHVLWLAVVGNTYFFFLGALLQFDIVFYGRDVLHVASSKGSLLQAAIAIGIGFGSLAAGYLSGGKIEYGLIPLGATGITIFGFLLALPGLSFAAVLSLLAALGFFGGFFIVPISALLQHRPEEQHRGGVLASANLLSFVGILTASVAYYLCKHFLRLGPAGIFFWASAGTLAALAYLLWLLPDSLLRLLLWIAAHTIYRLDLKGQEVIPARGGALLTPNHTSWVDAVLLIAATDRPIRFIMFKGVYDNPVIKPFAKMLKIIPIASDQGPREMIHSLRAASEALREGEVVCIFPEGEITRIGQMLPFRRGFERIIKGIDAPIIPVNIDGIWGSIFSFSGGRFLWKWPRTIPYPVRITFGKPLPSTATAPEVRQAVQELGVDAFQRRRRYMKPLSRSFIKAARRHPRRFAMADGRTPKLTFGDSLIKTVFLARRLRPLWRDQKMVGILLPPSIPGALVNWAALLLGKVPINLNYTSSNESILSCAQQCALKTVVTSRQFLEKVPAQPPGEAIYAEDLALNPRFFEKISAFLAAKFFPARLLETYLGVSRPPSLDDTATIIFSSGSTGEPKGVVLSHFNLASNVEQLEQVFHLHDGDRILGILPFFHSFGFTGTLCLPPLAGMGVVFHVSPLDAQAIGALVSKYSVTMLLSTPTFLNTYARRCPPEVFGSLRIVMAGAEKLPERIAQTFEEHFGIRPLEGYGCTECSPVVAVNTYDFRAAYFRQVGAKRGTIGHPLPGIGVHIMDPESGEKLPVDKPGLLLVRGPNVMVGYLNRPEKTAEVLKDGWYNTGDIATVDEDGFLRITDRLSRFSKIGGEMVPHIRVEETLHELIGADGQVLAVTAIPDEKKGERLVVIQTLKDEALKDLLEKLAKSDLPALWKPRPDQFIYVEKLPYLGTGKLDLRKLREIAMAGGVAAQ